MRSKLGEFHGQRQTFRARLARTCLCHGHRKDTALLYNVENEKGEILADHAWVKLTNELLRVPLGSDIEFEATVGEYTKLCGDSDYNLIDIRLQD